VPVAVLPTAKSLSAFSLKPQSDRLLVHRRSGHEGVERRPELSAIVILLLQDIVPAVGLPRASVERRRSPQWDTYERPFRGVIGGARDLTPTQPPHNADAEQD